MQMSSRERLCAALRSKPVDKLPWAPLMDGYFTSSLPKQGFDFDLIQSAQYIGCDLMERHVASPREIFSNVTTRLETHPGGSREYFDTPVGSIYVERKNSGKTSYICKHLVENIEDVKVFQYIAEHTSYEPCIQEFIDRDKEIGDLGIATLSGNMSPIQEFLQLIAGIENTVYLMADYPEEMDELFNTMQKRNLQQYKALLEYPCDYIFDYEDTSTTVMNLTMFTDYTLPVINEYSDLVHSAGKVFITHMCGKLTGFVNEIGSGRQDGIDSVCPPNTGDLYPWDARKIWGPSKVVIGGIDPPELSRITKEKAVETAREVIERVENKVGFILSTGDAVAHGTPIDNMKAITQLINEMGADSVK